MKSFPWQILIDWYSENGRHDYPWRQYNTAKFGINTLVPEGIDNNTSCTYRVWLAEILLQQTQADRVVPFYTRILGRYPTIQSLANSTYDEFFPYYQGLGYYSRARNLLKTAHIVSTEYGGIFPKDKTLLKKLPGVGEYTARAILAFGYGEALLAWDTNLETIFSRYYKGAKNIKLTEDEKNEIEGDFQKFLITYGGLIVNSAGFGERNCLSQIENSTTTAKETNAPSRSVGSTLGVFSLPNSFGTFSTKSTERTVRKQRDSYGMTKNKDTVRDINNALMDWARTMEPKNSSLLDTNSYIFTESEFYRTKGSSEVIEKNISVSFPTPDAQIIVILHQDHRIYYSLSIALYSPFILPASEDRDTRRYVQDYFRKNHQLELSVRPVHKKWITKDGQPCIAVNAQIQAGDPSIFEQYNKIEMKTPIELLYSL